MGVPEESDPSVEDALGTLVETANALPGAFSAEIDLCYHAGVIDGKRWSCGVEADMYGQSFTVWANSPQQAITLAVTEAWRRVPDGDNPAPELASEWYWRDAWVLAAALLGGADADLADVIGGTRRSSTPSVFINREELGWATSRLLASGLLTESGPRLVPSATASELRSRATRDRPTLRGSGFTRSLLREMHNVRC